VVAGLGLKMKLANPTSHPPIINHAPCLFFVHFVFYFLSYFALFNESSKLGELSLRWTITQKLPIPQGAEPAFEIWESEIENKIKLGGSNPQGP
jgi:hypothetical protein